MALFRRVLVPHDFSPAATAALRLARRLVAPSGRLTVLHVVPTTPPISEVPLGGAVRWTAPTADVDAAARELSRATARVVGRTPACRVDCRAVDGDPVERILAAARQADVIVMGAAGRRGVERLVLGGVAEAVVRAARVPVMTVRGGVPAPGRPTRRTAAGRTRRR